MGVINVHNQLTSSNDYLDNVDGPHPVRQKCCLWSHTEVSLGRNSVSGLQHGGGM